MSQSIKSEADYPRDHPGRASGWKRLAQATQVSMEGLASCFKHEEAFRLEVYAFCLLFPAALIFPIGLAEKAILIGSLAFVFVTELLNTALETAIDYISRERHPLAKRAKDLGSAAVFVSLVTVPICWTLILSANWKLITAWIGY